MRKRLFFGEIMTGAVGGAGAGAGAGVGAAVGGIAGAGGGSSGMALSSGLSASGGETGGLTVTISAQGFSAGQAGLPPEASTLDKLNDLLMALILIKLLEKAAQA